MTPAERAKLQKYLSEKFATPRLSVREGTGKDAPAEVFINDEFIAVIYKNVDEGEVSFDMSMSILDIDLD